MEILNEFVTVHQALEAAKATAEAKGYYSSFSLSVEDGEYRPLRLRVYFWASELENSINESFYPDEECPFDIDQLLARFAAFMADLPTVEEAKAADFQKQLVKLVQYGRDVGIETDFLNPLEDMMKKLSTNIITHRKY